MKYTLFQGVQVETVTTNLQYLAEMWRSGKLISFHKWLQRLLQEKKWKSNKSKKARQYLTSLFGTKGVVQGFLICDISLLIDNLKEKRNDEPNLSSLWTEMIDWLEIKKEKGATHIVLDGQNRLAFAICPFLFDNLPTTLTITSVNDDGSVIVQEKNNVTFESLSDFGNIQSDILNHPIMLQAIVSGNVETIRNQIIAINEGEAMTQNEKRATNFTIVSFHINATVEYSLIVPFFQSLKKVFTGDKYDLEKKGDVRFLAEFLYYLRNGSVGTEKQLDQMYHAKDEKIEKQLKYLNELFIWVAKNLTKSIIEKINSKELFRHLLISITRMIDKTVPGYQDVDYHIKDFNQIKNPSLFLEKIVDKLNEMLQDDDNFVTRYGDNGKVLPRLTRDAKAHSFYAYHTGSSENDLRAREKLFTPTLNEVINECKSKGIIITHDARKIDQLTKMKVQKKHSKDVFERFPTKNLVSFEGMELDHIISVKKGGTADEDNLQYTAKKYNRQKGAS